MQGSLCLLTVVRPPNHTRLTIIIILLSPPTTNISHTSFNAMITRAKRRLQATENTEPSPCSGVRRPLVPVEGLKAKNASKDRLKRVRSEEDVDPSTHVLRTIPGNEENTDIDQDQSSSASERRAAPSPLRVLRRTVRLTSPPSTKEIRPNKHFGKNWVPAKWKSRATTAYYLKGDRKGELIR